MTAKTSSIPGFRDLDMAGRRRALAAIREMAASDLDAALAGGGLEMATADKMVENAIGTLALPFGVALNVHINGADYLVPMAIEEPSVVAATSHAAKRVRGSGGFTATTTEPLMAAQIEVHDVADPAAAVARIREARAELLAMAAAAAPGLADRGGGPRDVTVRALGEGFVVTHVVVNVCSAMGANMINTVAEALGERVAELAGGTLGLRILTNLCDRRLTRVTTRIPVAEFGCRRVSGAEAAAGVASASRFAELDPYRAVTHNKGIMNGVDAVVLATGNDWRAVEAAAHAYAARSGQYRPLATWRVLDGGRDGGRPKPRRRARGHAGDAARARHGRRRAAGAPGRAAGARSAGRHRRGRAVDGRGHRGARHQPRRPARARHRGHPARAHGAAPPHPAGGRRGPQRSRRAAPQVASSWAILARRAIPPCPRRRRAPPPRWPRWPPRAPRRTAEKRVAGAVVAGERYGGLVPEGATAVRVDRASVAFELLASVASAAVTATYRLRNTGAEAESTDVAFAFTRGERDDDPGARVSVTVDGAPLPMRTQRDVDLLGPRLNGWLDDHPDIDRALRAPNAPDAPDGAARLQGLVEAAGGRCGDGCRHLVAWHRSVNGDEEQRLPARAVDAALLGAVREAIPGAFADLADHWTALGGRAGAHLGFLLFHVDFEPGQARAVTLRYVHRAEVLETGDVSSTYAFDYPFAPARRWAGFGPLDVSVHVPGRARFTARPALEHAGETWRASFPGLVGGDPQTPGPAGLPTRDLRFEVMSLEGLWLGMTEPGGYRAIAAAAIAAAAIAVGARPGAPSGAARAGCASSCRS